MQNKFCALLVNIAHILLLNSAGTTCFSRELGSGSRDKIMTWKLMDH